MKYLKTVVATCLFSLLAFTAVFAQDAYEVQEDSRGDKMLVGDLNMELLANDPDFGWFYKGINSYEPDKDWTDYLKYYRDSFQVIAFVGTWQGESRELLPKFYRSLMAAGYPLNKIRLIGVDENFKSLGDEVEQYNVQYIPSFIILDEMGKILGIVKGEHTENSIEANLVSVLQRKFIPEGN